MSLTSEMHQVADKQSEDRIGSLPSSLIGYILSFLPTKDAVATSVLSTTWKEFWKLITRLDIDDYLLKSPLNKDRTELLQAEFVDFVYRVLLVGRFPWIEAFSLRCCRSYSPHYVSAWLGSVLKSNVQELDVSVRFEVKDFPELPRCLFTCQTLVKLKLKHFYMNIPGSVYFPCLKLVKLTWVEFSDGDSITRFFSGCPVLEDLSLLHCIAQEVKLLKISVPSLTSLSLKYLRITDGFKIIVVGGDVPTLRVVLDTPFLQQINIEEHVPNGYVFENVDRLTKRTEMGNQENDMLELDASQSGPNCLLLHLKTVEIVYLRREVVLVEYLLRNARLLEKLTVRRYGYKKELPEAGELLLLTLPRASSACEIEIS